MDMAHKRKTQAWEREGEGGVMEGDIYIFRRKDGHSYTRNGGREEDKASLPHLPQKVIWIYWGW